MNVQRGHVERIRNRWYLRIRGVDPVTGLRKQRREPLGNHRDIRSRERARSIADEWLARQSPSTLRPGLAVRFFDFAEWYLATHVAGLRAQSRRRYAIAVTTLQRELGRELIANVDASRLKIMLNSFANSQAHATVRFNRGIALAMLRRARDAGYGAHVVTARDVVMPRNTAPKRERPSFTRAQLDRILEASNGQWRALWAVMAFAGLRPGEALALRWRDVDFDHRTIYVRRTLTRDGIGAPKTKASDAGVPMLPELAQILVSHRAASTSAELVFSNRCGRALDPDNVRSRRLRPLVQSLGLPAAGLHAFRHSTLGLLNSLGIAAGHAKSFMRHANLAVTDRYLHSDFNALHAAVVGAADGVRRIDTTGTAL